MAGLLSNINIGIAQTNTVSGNFEYNSKEIAKHIKYANNNNIELLLFPKSSIVGYSMQNVLSRHTSLKDDCNKWLNEIAKLANYTVILGIDEENYAIVNKGKIVNIFNTFPFIYNGIYLTSNQYTSVSSDINLIVDFSAIHANASDIYAKQKELSEISKSYKIPVIHVNNAGATDNILFAGSSSVFNKNGNIFTVANAFKEDFIIVNTQDFKNETIGEVKQSTQCEFSLDYEYDMVRVYNAIIQGIRDYFNKCNLKRAVLGLSGGLDSTVCAVLLADALGKDNVIGISMPSKITTNESKSDAEQLARNIGIHFFEAPIKDIVESTKSSFKQLFDKMEKEVEERHSTSYTNDNIQARARATYLWGVSNEFSSCIPIATSDKSEAYMGYATINGDMSGGFAPIADITKTKLFALARWLNKNRKIKDVIPQSIINKRPGAELAIDPNTGKPLCAEDALMPYEFMDEIIWRIENKNEGYNDFVNSKFLYEKTHNISNEQKLAWIDKFYKRMSHALYKWSIMPPAIVVEDHTINKAIYNQPITSGNTNFKGYSTEEIQTILKTV